jgi:hypothetical protein
VSVQVCAGTVQAAVLMSGHLRTDPKCANSCFVRIFGTFLSINIRTVRTTFKYVQICPKPFNKRSEFRTNGHFLDKSTRHGETILFFLL